MSSWLSVIAVLIALVNLVTTGIATYVVLTLRELKANLRADLATFKNEFLQQINETFIRKPDQDDLMPLSRREFHDYVAGAREHRIAFEQKIERYQLLEERVRSLEVRVVRRAKS